jgi:hypothetical protein
VINEGEGGKMKNLKNSVLSWHGIASPSRCLFRLRFLVVVGLAMTCLLSSVFCSLSYAGLAVSITGGDWAVGTTGMGMTSTTTAAKWTITGSNVVETVYIKADGTNCHPGSAAGDKVFVLKHNASGIWSAVITNSGDGIKLKSLNQNGTATFGLQFTAPTASTDVTGEQALTVTLTAKAYAALIVGEWETIDANLVCVGTATGYLMWPRLLSCAATNSNVGLLWKTESTAGIPTWSNTTKVYTYPSGEISAQYPAFAWAEALEYAGYTDWRMPTLAELNQLYAVKDAYIAYAALRYWSGEQNSDTLGAAVDFTVGGRNEIKNSSRQVRAVRSGP